MHLFCLSCNYCATIDFYKIYKLLNKLKLLIIYCQSIIGATEIRGVKDWIDDIDEIRGEEHKERRIIRVFDKNRQS